MISIEDCLLKSPSTIKSRSIISLIRATSSSDKSATLLSEDKFASSQIFFEEEIQNPYKQTVQTGRVGSFFDGTNWQVWLLQLMTDKINPKEYWKKDVSCVPRLKNFVYNTLPDNQKNSVPHNEYLSHIYTLK